MAHDLTPCPRRDGGKPCQRTFGEQRCTFCDRELPLSHPTFVSEVAESMRANAAGLPDDRPRPEVLAAARRIKRATLALADRDAGIDTSRRRPLVASLPALQAQLSARRDVSLRTIEQILDDVVPMLVLLQAIEHLVAEQGGVDFSEHGQHERAALLIEAIREVLERAAPASPWAAGADIPDAPATCDECGATLAHIVGRGSKGQRYEGVVCTNCDLGRRDDEA